MYLTMWVFPVPVGPTMKIQHREDGEMIGKKFSYLAKKFGIDVSVDINETFENAGRGIGPVLEARDVFQVLEQHPIRPKRLEEKAIRLSGKLIDLCFADIPGKKSGNGQELARNLLVSGKALESMKSIVYHHNELM